MSPTETRDERFKRIAEKRVNAVLDKLRLLSQTSNRGNYDYTDEQVSKMFRVIRSAVTEAEASFKPRARSRFKL